MLMLFDSLRARGPRVPDYALSARVLRRPHLAGVVPSGADFVPAVWSSLCWHHPHHLQCLPPLHRLDHSGEIHLP